ncbi:hypothetical protein D3C77_513260 [compost metagenome]
MQSREVESASVIERKVGGRDRIFASNGASILRLEPSPSISGIVSCIFHCRILIEHSSVGNNRVDEGTQVMKRMELSLIWQPDCPMDC